MIKMRLCRYLKDCQLKRRPTLGKERENHDLLDYNFIKHSLVITVLKQKSIKYVGVVVLFDVTLKKVNIISYQF
jgi:hypothetical protein